jgi:hypothetical protein
LLILDWINVCWLKPRWVIVSLMEGKGTNVALKKRRNIAAPIDSRCRF